MHSCTLNFTYIEKKTKSFFSYFLNIFECDNLTLQTRAQRKKDMEQREQNQVVLKGDMDSVKGNMKEMKDKMDQL